MPAQTVFAAALEASVTSVVTNGDTVKVIPNCKTSYVLNNKNNIGGTANNLIFSASQTITATNIIFLQSKVSYKAAKSVTLLPGFQATSGTVFTALIAGCVNGPTFDTQSSPPPETQTADKPKMSPTIQNKE